MTPRVASHLVVLDGFPYRVFPAGAHVFPADLTALRALASALAEDAREAHAVPTDLLGARREEPFALPRLRAFVAESWPAFALAARDLAAEAAARYARARAERLRALGAPAVLVDAALAWLREAESPGFAPAPSLADLLPDAAETAAVVDVEAWQRSGWPLRVGADASPLVLLAAACCAAPDAAALEPGAPWLDALPWESLLAFPEPELVPGAVVVHPTVPFESVERLAFADVRASPDASPLAPAGALLAVSVPPDDAT